MQPYYSHAGITILQGDCLEAMPRLDPASVDAVVTDPPYDLLSASRNGSRRVNNDPDKPFGRHAGGFMGMAWDGTGVAFQIETWAEVLRVLKPGGYLLAFGGPRTWHRLAVAIEDSGFYLTDSLCWLFGSGFPKAKSCLKPAWEPIILARKPAERVLPLQIDACRILLDGSENMDAKQRQQTDNGWGGFAKSIIGKEVSTYKASGRWPANVVLDADAAAMLDEQSGELTSGDIRPYIAKNRDSYSGSMPALRTFNRNGDTGGASRFFYTAKASRSERNAGLDDLPEKPLLWSSGTQSPGTFQSDGTHKAARNAHPTVKPLALMRWLVRLVTPTAGIVLDPFLGSGSTGVAAVQEGFNFIGIEKEREYAEIARRRIEHAIGPLFVTP